MNTLMLGKTANGDLVPLRVSAAGRQNRDGSVANSAALEASRVLKAAPGTLVAVIGYNGKASAQFIQLHDAAAVPADGAAPVAAFTVPAASNFSLDIPIAFGTGIVVCNSSTAATKTIGAADCFFTAVVE